MTVDAYWQAMQSNDFELASSWLSDTVEIDWPLTNERICGKRNFIEINQQYPAQGLWSFRIERMVVQGDEVVTDVAISDGVRKDRAVTFHRVQSGKIVHQTEYWPENYAAAEWRSDWVVPIR
ncbi:nuclear transport factor 2 family protein [Vibrio sp. SCSIO 43136]|uniref:nuclear transport factor 2 family protein n=1 Tax=Vibrio sp. SCSIO 43136 TaxID=2819101 RepID=UPI002075210C|nr:nuclear transport factor 2 family protein [Vibrio sp. SCSIO 43136]